MGFAGEGKPRKAWKGTRMSRTVYQFAPYVGGDECRMVGECFDANWLTEGPKSKEFLSQLRDLMGVKHACLAPNGTLALYLGLRAIGVGHGDEVIVPDFTFFGSASAVEMTGARPVFCDIDSDTLQVRAADFERAITPRTKALMPVHIYGMTCAMDPIMELAEKRGLLVLEDAAQAVNVFYKGCHAGTMGNAGCFSFFADKTITTGEGGLVVSNDDVAYEKLRFLRNQGRENRGSFVHPEIGYNFRMTDLQTAVGLVQLGKLDEICRKKKAILEQYHARLDSVGEIRFISVTPGSSYVPFRIAVYAQRAHELMAFLETKGVQSRTFFYPLHKQPAFEPLTDCADYGGSLDDTDFPGAISAYENGVCLPSYPALPDGDIEYVCDGIEEFYGRGGSCGL